MFENLLPLHEHGKKKSGSEYSKNEVGTTSRFELIA